MNGSHVFFTETAANLLESQGYRAKAAEVFLFLSFRHPEKADYFRSRFEALQDDLIWVQHNQELVDLLYIWIDSIAGQKRLECLEKMRAMLLQRKQSIECHDNDSNLKD